MTTNAMEEAKRDRNLQVLKEITKTGVGGLITFEHQLAVQWAINELEGRLTGDPLQAMNCEPPRVQRLT
jgi:hypothetical protein